MGATTVAPGTSNDTDGQHEHSQTAHSQTAHNGTAHSQTAHSGTAQDTTAHNHTAHPTTAHPTTALGEAATAEGFKAAFRGHPGGVALITADAGEGPVAMTATSVASVSVDPHLLVFSVSDLSSSARTLNDADTVVVHLLDAESIALAQLGATSGIDRFADESLWSTLPTGEPAFHDAPVRIRGRIVSRIPSGTATVMVVEAEQIFTDADRPRGAALVHYDRTWHRLDETSEITS